MLLLHCEELEDLLKISDEEAETEGIIKKTRDEACKKDPEESQSLKIIVAEESQMGNVLVSIIIYMHIYL
jgi:hypothetical protein